MKNKKAYFSNVPSAGDLYLYDEFLSMEIPILFLCNDVQNNMYICSCFELYPHLSWIISSIEKLKIIDFIENKISIADVFRKGNKKYVAVWSKEDRCVHVYQISQYDDKMLPNDDAYLDAENGEYDDIKKSMFRV